MNDPRERDPVISNTAIKISFDLVGRYDLVMTLFQPFQGFFFYVLVKLLFVFSQRPTSS